jgi:hypothetical protein
MTGSQNQSIERLVAASRDTKAAVARHRHTCNSRLVGWAAAFVDMPERATTGAVPRERYLLTFHENSTRSAYLKLKVLAGAAETSI